MRKKVVGNDKQIDSMNLKPGELIKEVEDLCSENLFGCYQCGTCSAGCPFVEEMDLSPDEVIRYVILDRKEVLNSKTIWLCSSCFTCAERCPRDINITKIMEALRQIILRKNRLKIIKKSIYSFFNFLSILIIRIVKVLS